ncbi:MAG TPA: hypothetical protein DCF62_04900 [Porticoccaceae bacterium]|nr:hypothetical protein [Porticoccaceae bacterium]HCO61031.1 hypothetical protein [Porticoccaceae bacterium]
MAAKALKNEKVRKILDRNDELVSKSVEKGQELAEKAVEYNREIWLAGLGAFANARDGSAELFDKLVSSGEEIEGRYKKTVNERSDSALKAVGNFLDKIPSPSEKIEDVFDSRVAKAMTRLGVVPTINALQTLTEQVEALTARIEEFADVEQAKSAGVAAKAPARRKTAAKKAPVKRKKVATKAPAAKRTTAKKATAKTSAPKISAPKTAP